MLSPCKIYLFLLIVLVPPLNAKNPVVAPDFTHSPSFPYRVDTARRIIPLFSPYDLNADLRGHGICQQFEGWAPTTLGWDKKLNPHGLTLCAKDYGGGGNCMFLVLAGVLKDNGYVIENFDLARDDLSEGYKISLQGFGFNPKKPFKMEDFRLLAALAFVGIDPRNSLAQNLLDENLLREKIEAVVLSLETAADIQWNPQACLHHLKNKSKPALEIAKYVFTSIASSNPVKTWGSGDDLYSISHMLNIDFIIFHRAPERIQHIMSPKKTPVCTVLYYYLEMFHFQAAGVVFTHTNSDTSILRSVYRHFELHENLYPLVPKKKSN